MPRGQADRAGARRAREPVDEERVDKEAWRRAEAQACKKVEDGRWLGFWRLEPRARKEWAGLHKLQEEMQQMARPGEAAHCSVDSGSGGPSARCVARRGGSGPGGPVEGWREDLDRYHKRERAALGKAHGESARQIERRVRETLITM